MNLKWDREKAERNHRAHGVTFLDAAMAFTDPFAVEVYGSYRLAGRRNMSKTTTIAKIRSDGQVVELLLGGGERALRRAPVRAMTAAEIHAAAIADRDARPMTPTELRTAKRVPRIKTLRRALGLTQEQFAARYRIPVGTLRDWEQGRAEPDQPARSYLRVIASDPDAVARALKSRAV